ncbi:hypothetical protein MBLNU13_g00175t1 [Cladosporium sp. NU13]
MHGFAHYAYEVALFASTGYSDIIEQHGNIEDATGNTIKRNDKIEEASSSSRGMDWYAGTVIVLLAGFICYQIQFYEPETGQFQHHVPPLVRATTGIARRVGADLVRFVLNILAMIAELIIEGGNGFWYTLRKFGRGIRHIITALEPPATRIWRYYDSTKHGHYANLTRQRFRRACAFSVANLPRAIAIGAVLNFVVVPSVMNSIFLDTYEIYPYQAPAWVLKARPENRPYVGSSSHCRPDCIDVQGIRGKDIHARLLTDIGLTEISHELQAAPTTITRTVIFAETEGPEIGIAGG